jgi:hypothetical protein
MLLRTSDGTLNICSALWTAHTLRLWSSCINAANSSLYRYNTITPTQSPCSLSIRGRGEGEGGGVGEGSAVSRAPVHLRENTYQCGDCVDLNGLGHSTHRVVMVILHKTLHHLAIDLHNNQC